MKLRSLSIENLVLLTPEIFEDQRGYFLETFRKDRLESLVGPLTFVQENLSVSKKNTLRGLHYQYNKPQGKLIKVLHGEIYDVAIDLRRSSKTFLNVESVILSSENRLSLYIPPYCAHGFFVLSDSAQVVYQVTNYYDPDDSRSISHDDPSLGIDWPKSDQKLLSKKDLEAKTHKENPLFP